MKVSEYKQMMAYLTRPGTKKENLKQIIKKSKPDNSETKTKQKKKNNIKKGEKST